MQNKVQQQQQKFAMIGQWHDSGLSQKAYCERNNIAYHVFHYWYKRYRDARAADDETSSFVKLNVLPTSRYAHTELIFPDGKRILFHQAVSSDYLKAVMG